MSQMPNASTASINQTLQLLQMPKASIINSTNHVRFTNAQQLKLLLCPTNNSILSNSDQATYAFHSSDDGSTDRAPLDCNSSGRDQFRMDG